MKKIYLLALVLLGLSAKAQYFQSYYGDSRNWELLQDGNNAYSGGNAGHFLIGPGGWSFFGDFSITIQRTDLNGNIGGPLTFNNAYALSNVVPPVSTPNFAVASVHSTEFISGSGFAIAGSYSDGAAVTPGVFYAFLDPMGNVMTSVGYFQTLPGVTYSDCRVQEIVESTINPGELYITGYLTDATTKNNKVFVLKVDQWGTLLWGATYDMTANTSTDSDIPFDITENTDINPTCNCNEVIVVGEHTNKVAGAAALPDGFLIRLNNFFGSPLQPVDFYGTPNTSETFTSIQRSTNPNIDPNSPGFIIGGHSNMGPSATGDMWFLAIDNGGTIVWDHLFDYNSSMGHVTHDYAFDIIERINTMGSYEYYLAGYTSLGDFGDEDVLVVKTDDFGNAVAGGQFTYGTIISERGIRIDQLNGFGPDADGIAVYSYGWDPMQTLGGFDHYLIKAYFNGVSACQYELRDPFQNAGSAVLTPSTPQEFWPHTFQDIPFYVGQYTTLLESMVCFTQADPDGSNARIAPTQPKGDKEAVVSPNPMAQGSSIATVELETESPATVQVAIYDMLGKQYYNGEYTLVKGKNQLPVDISSTNMAAGMYTVKVSGLNINKNILLMVK